ncbi:MAG: protein kinase domain-containing protein [Tepidisphaeraceae bacterium]
MNPAAAGQFPEDRAPDRRRLLPTTPESADDGAPPPLDALEPPLPEFIGSYRIHGILGQGGMGVVYRAEQLTPHRPVALKVVRIGMFTRQHLRRFEHEAEVLGRLQHPGIAQIYEAGVADSSQGRQPFFAMELVAGRSLTDFASDERLSSRQRLGLMILVCQAVQYAHQRGVIHRDLKPGNILVDAPGQPKILDFGIARVTDSDIHATMETGVGQIVGTLPYMSPEQAAGDAGALDTRSDVYALGVITYELLAGRLPHSLERRAITEAVRIIREDEPARISTLDRALRGDVETIVRKSMEKDRERRYPSAGDLAADMQRFLNSEPISARPPTTMYQLRKFAARNRALVAGVALVFLVLLGAVVVTSYQAHRIRLKNELAQSRFQDVRALANRMMFAFSDKIEHLPGSTPAQQLLVESSLEYLNKLARQAGDDPGLLRELGIAYAKVGDIQGNPNYGNVGDTSGALASYQRAIEITHRLAVLDKDNLSIQNDLMSNHCRVGDIYLATGDISSARATYALALETGRAALSVRPADVPARRGVAICLTKLGDIDMLAGNVDNAMKQYESAMEIVRGLGAEQINADDAETDLADVYEKLGDALMATGKHQEAMDHHQKSLALSRRLVARDAHNARRQRGLSVALIKIGDVLAYAEDGPGATAYYHEALDLRRRLSQVDPTNVAALRDVMVSENKVGDMLLAAGDPSAALARFDPAMDRARRLCESDPRNVEYRRDLAVSHYEVGRACSALGESESASKVERTAHYQRAVALFDQSTAIMRKLQSDGKLTRSDEAVFDELQQFRDAARQGARLLEAPQPATVPATFPHD